MQRMKVVLGHLSGGGRQPLRANPCLGLSGAADADDVVVVHGRRTPIGKAKRGGLKVSLVPAARLHFPSAPSLGPAGGG